MKKISLLTLAVIFVLLITSCVKAMDSNNPDKAEHAEPAVVEPQSLADSNKTVYSGDVSSVPADNSNNASTDKEQSDEVSMSIKEGTLTNKGITIILRNNTDEEYTYGPEYHWRIIMINANPNIP